MYPFENQFKIARWIAEDMMHVIREADKAKLDRWLEESEDNKAVYQEFKADFLAGKGKWPYSSKEVQEQLDRLHKQTKRKPSIYRYWYGYAAMLVLFIGLFGIVRWHVESGREAVTVESKKIQVARGEVKLILSNGREVVLSDTLTTIREEAKALIQVAGQAILYEEENGDIRDERYNTLRVPGGTEYNVRLADGSVVWLNSRTELRYPVQFVGDQRVVYLEGEAYFEVMQDAGKPFVVKTKAGVDVKVLGTKFNISSYSEDADVTTTLVQGSVEVMMPGEKVRIVPDEQLVFNKNEKTYSSRRVDASASYAWKEGMFVFEDQTLEKIMDCLKRWYDMDVFFTNKDLKNYRFSGDLKKYESFEKIVKMIEEVSGVKIKINDKCVTIGI